MATAKKWINVAVTMQSAIAAAKTITAISKANPGVCSSTSHGYTNGDIVVIAAQGMYQVDGRAFRVASAVADSFALEGEDTTLYDTFTSGNAQKSTMGVSLTTATTINAAGGEFDFIDTTTIHGNVKTQIPGLPSAATFTMDNIWDVSDAGLVAMKAAADVQGLRAFKFQFGPGGQIMLFNGYVGANLLPGGTAQQLVTTRVVITMFGRPTYYAS